MSRSAKASELASVFNGNLTDRRCIAYWCPTGICDIRALAHQMAELLKHTFYSSLPEIPIAATWMRVAATFRWWAGIMVVHGVGIHVHNAAFNPRSSTCKLHQRVTEVLGSLDSATATHEDEPEIGTNTNYYRGLGIRVTRSLSFLSGADIVVLTVLTHQLTDLLAQPMGHILAQSTDRRIHMLSPSRPIPVLDMQYPPASIITWTAQCLAAYLIRPISMVIKFAAGLPRLPTAAVWACFRMTVESIAGVL